MPLKLSPKVYHYVPGLSVSLARDNFLSHSDRFTS